ncbi:FadR/GntR family transcriptional regulator [Micromonospora sp. KLBMP9576]|uniref:FadR/GntR family transcriptional regulator n=1 Tax=Micromonospora sp. KLBMP9576 TaxID=3424769 RepID=UPI003D8A6612
MAKDVSTGRARRPVGTGAGRPGAAGPLAVTRVLPAYQQVADQLRDRILDGSLASGDRLPTEVELAEIFGVSRSTVREALRVLASKDLIRTTRGITGGTFVARVRFDQVSEYLEMSLGLMSGARDIALDDLLEARECIEVPAAALAALRREDQHVELMRQAVEREKLTRARGTKFREHRNFHGVLVDATGNQLLGVMSEPLFRVLQARTEQHDMPADYWSQIDAEHTRICSYVESGDVEGARTAMREHLATVRRAYEGTDPLS